MNLKDLAQLDIKDLKNLDYREVLKVAKSRPDIIITAAIILVSIFTSIAYFNSKQNTLKTLTRSVSTLENKWALFEEFQKATNVLRQLKSSFPDEITEAGLIEIITQHAEQYYITIESFSQAAKNEHPSYRDITLSLTASATSYNDLWKFIARIEKNKTIRIDTLRCSPGSARIIRSSAPKAQTITANLTLTAVNFKNG